jgi:hypothetical protein
MRVLMHVHHIRMRSGGDASAEALDIWPRARRRAPNHAKAEQCEERGVMLEDMRNGMPATDLQGAIWRKSRRSNSQGDCVELAGLPRGMIAVRNSRHPGGPALIYTRAEIDAFIRGARNGDFDDLVS